MRGEFGGYRPEGAESWHPKRTDYEEPSTPEKPEGRPIERDSQKTIESPDNIIARGVEKKNTRERLLALFLLIENLLRQKLYTQAVALLGTLSNLGGKRKSK